MLSREEISVILNEAQRMDEKCQMFGASRHKYLLNPPIRKSFVRQVEERYGFQLPEDYFHFITEVGDGGAGPDYGISPFSAFMIEGKSPGSEKFREAYRRSLTEPFTPRPMLINEVEEYAIATRKAYEQDPGRYFIYEKQDENELCDTSGFLVLGTHGCQWDFGLIISGEKRGQVFDTDNEGAYGFVACSFEQFYQNWLDWISDKERFLEELQKWKKFL